MACLGWPFMLNFKITKISQILPKFKNYGNCIDNKSPGDTMRRSYFEDLQKSDQNLLLYFTKHVLIAASGNN